MTSALAQQSPWRASSLSSPGAPGVTLELYGTTAVTVTVVRTRSFYGVKYCTAVDALFPFDLIFLEVLEVQSGMMEMDFSF